jgi:hypothetical protein
LTAGGKRGFSVGTVAAIVAVLTGGTSLFLTLRPDLARDPRTTIGASIASAEIDTHVTRPQYFKLLEPDDLGRRRKAIDRYLADQILKDPKASKDKLLKARRSNGWKKLVGSVVYIVASGQGLKNRDVKVYWFVYDGTSGQRQDGGGQSALVTLKAPDDRFILPTFIPDVDCRQLVFVRLELRDEDSQMLSMGSTKRFRSCSATQG